MKFWLQINELEKQLKNQFRISKINFMFEITLTEEMWV